MSDEDTLDVIELTRGLLRDLRDAYRARPPRTVERSEGSGITQIQKTATLVKADRDAGLEGAEASYRERAEDAASILTQRQRRIKAYAKRERRVVTADPGKFIMAGRVVDASTGVGLPNVRVNAFDSKRTRSEPLGATHTDALGYFRFEYSAAELRKLGENPRASLEILDDDEKVVFTSEKAVSLNLGGTQFVSAEIDGARVPTKRDLAARIDRSLTGRIEDIQRRILVSKPRGDLPLRRLRGVSTLAPLPKQPPSGKRAVPAGSAAELETVKGIGPEFASRLAAKGVTAVQEVAAMKPEALATILNTSVRRAKTIIVDARRIAKPT